MLRHISVWWRLPSLTQIQPDSAPCTSGQKLLYLWEVNHHEWNHLQLIQVMTTINRYNSSYSKVLWLAPYEFCSSILKWPSAVPCEPLSHSRIWYPAVDSWTWSTTPGHWLPPHIQILPGGRLRRMWSHGLIISNVKSFLFIRSTQSSSNTTSCNSCHLQLFTIMGHMLIQSICNQKSARAKFLHCSSFTSSPLSRYMDLRTPLRIYDLLLINLGLEGILFWYAWFWRLL